MKKILTLLIFILSAVAFSASAQSIDYNNLAPHPRILLTKGDVSKMRELPAQSANAKMVKDRIMALAEGWVDAEAVKYDKSEGDLSAASREALRRIFYLSYAHAMTDDMRFVAAAEREMMAVSAFEDWNPAHFTDVAEFTMALSIGYDWLYRRLSVRSRSIIGTAIYEKGLLATESADAEFINSTEVNNQICCAGIIYGALATLERSPEYCKALIDKCLGSNKQAMAIYAPDGAHPDGYDTWSTTTGFETLLVAALESSLGTDAGITSQNGFMQTANFINQIVAPSGKLFNYGDCRSEEAESQIAKYWFAGKLGDPSLVAIDEKLLAEGKFQEDNFLPAYMIWTCKQDLKSTTPSNQKNWQSWQSEGETPLFIYRSGWSKGDDYFAIKGGKVEDAESHQDGGSFIYEVDGIRWAIDLGDKGDNAAKAEWHNTITFNGQPHRAGGKAEITAHSITNREKSAEVDLSPLFADHARSVKRQAHLDKKNCLTITDIVEGISQPAVMEWRMATNATAEIMSPQIIMLQQDGQTLYLKLKSRAKSEAKIWQAENGVTRVGFVVELKAGEGQSVEVAMSQIKPNVISRIKSFNIKNINLKQVLQKK